MSAFPLTSYYHTKMESWVTKNNILAHLSSTIEANAIQSALWRQTKGCPLMSPDELLLVPYSGQETNSCKCSKTCAEVMVTCWVLMLATHPVLSSITWQTTIFSKINRTPSHELDLQGKSKPIVFHHLRSQKPAAHKFAVTVNLI